MENESELKRLTRNLKEDEDTKFETAKLIKDLAGIVALTSSMSDNEKVTKVIAGFSVAFSVFSVAKNAIDYYKKQTSPDEYIIRINESDDIFDIAESWFMDALPEEKQLAVFAHSSIERSNSRKRRRGGRGSALDELDYPSTPSNDDKVDVLISFDGTITQEVSIAGHTVKIYTDTPQSNTSSDKEKKSISFRTINFNCPSIEARNAVLNELERQAQDLSKEQPNFYTSVKWGRFDRNSSIPRRELESVVLKEGQMDRIFNHLHKFLDNEESYVRLGIPFRTGVLLYGNPGSGKSSTAASIAHELGMDIYNISLSSLDDDDALSSCMSQIPPRSVVILEDVDVAHAVKERDDDTGVTMSGMLNVLDGFHSPHGVIMLMTTNRIDILDDAITRPGRVDLKEELNEIDTYQLRGLCEYFIGYVPDDLPHITPEDGITSAEIIGEVKNHIPNFHNAGEDIVNYVKKRLLTKV